MKGSKSRFFKSPKKDITAALIFKAAAHKDKLSKEIVNETTFYLGIAIANIANALNPQIVVLSGGMIKAGRLLFDSIRKTTTQRALKEMTKGLKIVPAKLKDEAGIVGAAYLNIV